MRKPALGDLVIYHARTDLGIARVDLVRPGNVAAFPWRQAYRRWSRICNRIELRNVRAVLPPDADPATIADSFNILRNRSDAERARLKRLHEERVAGLISSLEGGN